MRLRLNDRHLWAVIEANAFGGNCKLIANSNKLNDAISILARTQTVANEIMPQHATDESFSLVVAIAAFLQQNIYILYFCIGVCLCLSSGKFPFPRSRRMEDSEWDEWVSLYLPSLLVGWWVGGTRDGCIETMNLMIAQNENE